MAVSAAIGIGLVGIGAGVYESNQQSKIAGQEFQAQQTEQAQLTSEITTQQTQSMQTESNTAIRNKAMQGKPGDVSSLEGGTIMTGALGIPAVPNNSNKTLLGL